MKLPFFTLSLVAANLWAFNLEHLSGGQAYCEKHGLVPASYVQHGGFEKLVSSMFMHDPNSIMHIAANMLFLLVFGALVESKIGSLRFLALYFAAGIVGGLVHVFVSPEATEPMVGASGAIFGIMAAAAMLKPRVALVFTAIYFAVNLVGLFAPELVGMHGVAIGAHVGGFVCGFLVMRVLFAKKMEEVAA